MVDARWPGGAGNRSEQAVVGGRVAVEVAVERAEAPMAEVEVVAVVVRR